MLPAVGQGVIGIECRRGDRRIEALIAGLDDPLAHDAIRAERALNAALDGGCQVPVAGHATVGEHMISMAGLVASIDGKRMVRATQTGPRSAAAALGTAVGRELLAAGAAELLAEIGTL